MECCALCPKPRAMWKLLYLTSCGHFSLKLLKREGQFQLAVGNTEKGLLVISSTSPGMTFRYPLSPLCSLHCFWLSIFVVISNSVSLEKPPLTGIFFGSYNLQGTLHSWFQTTACSLRAILSFSCEALLPLENVSVNISQLFLLAAVRLPDSS